MAIEVTNGPFSAEQVELLNRLLPSLDGKQIIWLSGYLAGVGGRVAGASSASGALGALASPAAASPPVVVTVLYASQTGNCSFLAAETDRRLREIKNLLVIVSTQGDGVPPDNGTLFYEDLFSAKAPRLPDLRFAVLALGDASYADFCKIGIEFDRRLEELGGRRIHPRVDCDLDFKQAAEGWMDGVVAALAVERGGASAGGAIAAPAGGREAFSRFNPFMAEVLENIALNGRGSDKETRHLELSLEGSGLSFEPGDSLGIYPRNHLELVDALIAEMGWNPAEAVEAGSEGEMPLREALEHFFEITVLTKPLLQAAAAFSTDGLAELAARGRPEEIEVYTRGRDLLDLVRDFGLAGAPAREFVRVLRRIPPRLYSIASSHAANPEEVHLVVTAVRYEAAGRKRKGVFSTRCAESLAIGDALPVYVNSNPAFRLPEDSSRPIIMIGPGTGVAPFRAFLEEREERGIRGKSWLFYGDRRFRTDFLYQLDWQRWLAEGVLSRMDVAFSRDGERKVYVQERMAERGRELFSWLEEGANVYVCGDEKHMASDVHAALERIIEREGGMSLEKAREYLDRLREENRYQRDVY